MNSARFYAAPAPDAFSKARSAATKAIEADRSLAEGHAQLAMVLMLYDWDFVAAEREFKSALSLDPSDSGAQHFYSHYLIAMGRMDESLAASRRAIEADPLSPGVLSHLGFHYNFARDYAAAIRACEETLEIAPGHSSTLQYLQTAYEQTGQLSKAIETLERHPRPPAYVSALKEALAREGAAGYWKVRLANILHPGAGLLTSSYDAAAALAHLEDRARALAFLQTALRERDPALVNVRRDAAFDSLRNNPEFIEIVHRIGLP